MDEKRVVIAIASGIFLVLLIVSMFRPSITGEVVKQQNLKIPDRQCYHIANNLDKAAGSNVEFISSGRRKSPCTGETMDYDYYRDLHLGAFTRSVYENGDRKGRIMMTSYIVCNDNRAEITSRIGAYYYSRGLGAWYNNPHLQYPFKTEKCSTI